VHASSRLIVLAGLPATGKSSIARGLASVSGAVWLRVDSIEQAIRESSLGQEPVGDAGYRAAYALARDNLLLGRDVIADSVNPWMLTRDAWRDVGQGCGARVLEVEVVCSDREEHRRRSETRTVDVPGLALPDWQAIAARDYRPWDRDHLVIDTAGRSVSACVENLVASLEDGHG
jgi:predicted kinase